MSPIIQGVACQVSSTVVSAVAAMTRELARSVAPVVVEKGGKVKWIFVST